MSNNNPIAKLTSAEALLVNAIDSTTAQVEQIATGNIEAALARLEEAIGAAKERIDSAVASMNEKVAGLVGSIAFHAASTAQALAANKLTPATTSLTIPAPIAEPVVSPSAPPATGEATSHSAGCQVEAQEHAQQPRQGTQESETTLESPTTLIETPDRVSGVAVAACAPVEPETAEQTMARVLLGGERHLAEQARDDRRPIPNNTTSSKRKSRGKRGQADANTSAAGNS